MIQACLNGNRRRTPSTPVPETPEQLANDAALCLAAGAAEFHIHPRDRNGDETLHPEEVAYMLSSVRESAPGSPVGTGTGYWISPGGRKRHDHIANWHIRPDYISLNMNEEDHMEVYDLVSSMGIGIEAGIWTIEDVSKFAELPRRNIVRILVEIADKPATEAEAEAHEILAALDSLGPGLPILLHGDAESAWPMVKLAARLGYSTRVGFEDMELMPDGLPAADNASIVSEAARLLHGHHD